MEETHTHDRLFFLFFPRLSVTLSPQETVSCSVVRVRGRVALISFLEEDWWLMLVQQKQLQHKQRTLLSCCWRRSCSTQKEHRKTVGYRQQQHLSSPIETWILSGVTTFRWQTSSPLCSERIDFSSRKGTRKSFTRFPSLFFEPQGDALLLTGSFHSLHSFPLFSILSSLSLRLSTSGRIPSHNPFTVLSFFTWKSCWTAHTHQHDTSLPGQEETSDWMAGSVVAESYLRFTESLIYSSMRFTSHTHRTCTWGNALLGLISWQSRSDVMAVESWRLALYIHLSPFTFK